MTAHSRHSHLQAGNLLIVQERDRAVAATLAREGYRTLETLRAIEVGCGGGYNLRHLVQLGATPSNLAGVDISGEALAYCEAHSPGFRLHHCDAAAIPEPSDSFDLGLAFTLFSSVTPPEKCREIAAELLRVVRPGGLILVYDMRRRNPANRSVHPVTENDVREWFRPCPVRSRSITLVPQVARAAPALYWPLARLPLLRTHLFHVVRRPLARAPASGTTPEDEGFRDGKFGVA